MTYHFLIDVDGVVADIVEATLQIVGKTTKSKQNLQDHCQEWGVWNTFRGWEYDTIMQCVHQPHFWRNLPLIEDAKFGIDALRRAGNQITWVTAPTWECPGWCDARVEWIHKYFGKGSNIIIAGDKRHIHGDIFIDDKLENVLAWKKTWEWGTPILFDAPYNRVNLENGSPVILTYDWDGIIQSYT